MKPGLEIVSTVHYVNVLVDGHDAEFWRDCYDILINQCDKSLSQFMFDDDEGHAEIYRRGIAKAGEILRDVRFDEETGELTGEARLKG